MDVLLLSTFELGRQSFAVASAAAELRAHGARVVVRDLSIDQLDEAEVRRAGLVAFSVPMHTATRLAIGVLARVRELAPHAVVCFFGLYAPIHESLLRELGVDIVIGGEHEDLLVEAWRSAAQPAARVSVDRRDFRLPDRAGLPELDRYAKLVFPDGTRRRVGYVEASRGCKHVCRHCPVVPVYGGRFRIVGRDVVLRDIEQQVEAGAEHITFGDPDFFNGIGHALAVVRELHRRFPQLSYDATIKVEHLLRYGDELAELARTGCAFVTTAVESVDDDVLRLLEKGHSRDDIVRAIELARRVGLPLAPTFVAFHPWTTLESYVELLDFVERHGLVGAVPPVQLTIRLLVPDGSLLRELEGVAARANRYDRDRLVWEWQSSDPRVDALQLALEAFVGSAEARRMSRLEVFRAIRERAGATIGRGAGTLAEAGSLSVPYLTEPWY